jgi:signal recognition particle subunit SEC65
MKSILDGLAMPSSLPPMRAVIMPPDPNDDSDMPTAYVWPADFDESRDDEQGGTVPRNTGPGTPSATKAIEHMIEVFIVYFQAGDDPDADSLFPGIVDAVTAAFRTSEDPAPITDPWTGAASSLFDVGEIMRGRIVVSATQDQAMNRLDCLLTCTVHELIRA